MASNLRALFAWDELPGSLRQFKDHLQTLLGAKYRGGLARDTANISLDPLTPSWTVHQGALLDLPDPQYTVLSASIACNPPISRLVNVCSELSVGNISYKTASQSYHDSRILYCLADGSEHVGIIRMIFEEVTKGRPEGNRIFLLMKRYDNIDEGEDALNDLFSRHPLLGKNGYDICRLHYATTSFSDTILADNIVSHVSICPYEDESHTFLKDTLVSVVLDRVSDKIFRTRQGLSNSS